MSDRFVLCGRSPPFSLSLFLSGKREGGGMGWVGVRLDEDGYAVGVWLRGSSDLGGRSTNTALIFLRRWVEGRSGEWGRMMWRVGKGKREKRANELDEVELVVVHFWFTRSLRVGQRPFYASAFMSADACGNQSWREMLTNAHAYPTPSILDVPMGITSLITYP